MKLEINVYNVQDKLPEERKKIMCFGLQSGMNPQMGGGYWFIGSRVDEKTLKHINKLMGIGKYDDNGFFAQYVTYWYYMPDKPF